MTDQIPRRMRDSFLHGILCEMNGRDDLFFVTADFGSPVLDEIRKRHADRFINVGIAEQNLINVSTGLALEGFRVFAYAIAPFITMRCLEQVRTNLGVLASVRPLHVYLTGVGVGMSYDVSGPTHQALEDVSIMRSIPSLGVFSPSDHVSAGTLPAYLLSIPGCHYIRLDGKALPPLDVDVKPTAWKTGFRVLRKGSGAVLVTTGYITHKALEVAQILERQNIQITVIDMMSLKTFDELALASLLNCKSAIFTAEEGFPGGGGLDCIILNVLNRQAIRKSLIPLGLRPEYRFDIGPRDNLLGGHGLDGLSIARIIQEKLAQTK